jgi:hypothetical protein
LFKKSHLIAPCNNKGCAGKICHSCCLLHVETGRVNKLHNDKETHKKPDFSYKDLGKDIQIECIACRGKSVIEKSFLDTLLPQEPEEETKTSQPLFSPPSSSPLLCSRLKKLLCFCCR